MLEGLTSVLLRIQEIKSHFRSMPSGGPVTIAPHFSGTGQVEPFQIGPLLPSSLIQDTGEAVKGVAQAVSAYDAIISEAAAKYNIDPALLKAVIHAESGFKPNAVSPAGAQGLMQLMPSTAAALGVTDPFDPEQNIYAGARYLRAQLDRFGGDVALALAAYNAGPGAVARYGGVPPYKETQRYVQRVLELRNAYLNQ